MGGSKKKYDGKIMYIAYNSELDLCSLAAKTGNDFMSAVSEAKTKRNANTNSSLFKVKITSNGKIVANDASNTSLPCEKSNFLILPLSTENEASQTGTAHVIQEFCTDFRIPVKTIDKYLRFDVQSKSFAVSDARQRFEFLEN